MTKVVMTLVQGNNTPKLIETYDTVSDAMARASEFYNLTELQNRFHLERKDFIQFGTDYSWVTFETIEDETDD